MKDLYTQAFDECMNTISEQPSSDKGGPANPLLIRPHDSYQSSKLKIMYFGQETNGYEGAYSESKGIDHLLGVYDEFVNKRNCYRYGGQFWNGVKHFQIAFKELNESSEFLWNNVIKIGKDWSKGRPADDVLAWQEPWFEIISQEVVKFSPDVTIFFTGPDYDHFIRKAFADVTFEPIDKFTSRQLVKVISQDLPENSYRTYHPNYLWRFGFHGVKETIIHDIKKANK